MKQFSRIGAIALLPLMLLLGTNAFAHTALKESVPADTAVINTAPGELKLVFNAAVSLIKLEVMHMGEHAVDIGFQPIADARSEFTLALPVLSPAAYTVNWSAIGADGHTVSDSFSFTVDPAATMQHGSGHGHEAGHQHDPAHMHEQAQGAAEPDHSDHLDH